MAWPAQTAPTCAARADMVAYLEAGHGERAVWAGLTDAGALLEIWTDAGDRSWTFLITWPGTRISCILAAGEAWYAVPADERDAL